MLKVSLLFCLLHVVHELSTAWLWLSFYLFRFLLESLRCSYMGSRLLKGHILPLVLETYQNYPGLSRAWILAENLPPPLCWSSKDKNTTILIRETNGLWGVQLPKTFVTQLLHPRFREH